jgi:uncharacterized protein
MEPRISIVTLGVLDMARSRAFYEAMGFRVSGASQGDIVFFQAGGQALALYPWDKLADDAESPPSGDGFRGVTLAHNVREKSEVAPVLAAAAAAGGRIVKPAHDAFWGGHSSYFADPDGHLWEVAWNPFFPIAADGALTLPD